MRNIEQILRKCENCKLNECDGCITYSDMQVIKARIKELEEELYSANKIVEEYLDGIPKQKIKEKINENSNMIREIEEKIKKEENSGDICEEYLSDLYKEKSLVERDILTLQELLQEEDK